jgi:cell division protein ZapA
MAKAEISLRGRHYSIACAPGQEERLVALSRELDARLNRIEQAVGDVGDERLLLVAALSMLDELSAARENRGGEPESQQMAVKALVRAAEQIEALTARVENRQ